MNPERAFGELLSKKRTGLKLQKNTLSVKLSISGATLGAWEDGRVFPKEDKLINIGRLYKIGIKKLKTVWQNSKDAREAQKMSGVSKKTKITKTTTNLEVTQRELEAISMRFSSLSGRRVR